MRDKCFSAFRCLLICSTNFSIPDVVSFEQLKNNKFLKKKIDYS